MGAESTPAIEDIDNDGDLEIIVGSTSGLEVIDIKFSAELMDSWSMYRGNMHRTGVYDASVMSLKTTKLFQKVLCKPELSKSI